MFAALFFERDPLEFSDVPGGLVLWVQVVGGFALFGATLWLLLRLPQWKAQDYEAVPVWQRFVFLGGWAVGLLGYAAGYAMYLVGLQALALQPGQAQQAFGWAGLGYLIGGCGAIVAVGLPFLVSVTGMRFGRIFALANLSFKEAIRARVLVVFALLAPVFLFGSWFINTKDEDQLRTYVGVVFFVMGFLLLAASALISAFSIPADIQRQTIHTIVTKPVERFEIAVGRFLGFYALMTLALIAMTGLSLIYVLRGVNPRAASETLLAREPLYGDLIFENTDSARKGINVGREWDYRGYITAPMPNQAGKPQAARWDFHKLDPRLAVPASGDTPAQILVEYTFDVYRTTKGKEGADVACTFAFRTWRFRPGDDVKFRKERQVGNLKLDDELAEKYGYFEIPGQPITDYKTQSFKLPAGLFRNALAEDAERQAELKRLKESPPLFQVKVTCDRQTLTQYVGMAKYDLFLRLDRTEASAWWFSVNFLKAAFGLWLQIGLMIGLAVVFSTYLNGVISLLLCVLLFLGGFCTDFIRSVAFNQNPGGGPLESMRTIASRQVISVKTSDSQTVGDIVVNQADDAFRFVVRRILNLLPEVERFNTTNYLAEGFNVPLEQMVITLLMMVGYLLPWFVLSYYLLKWREIASAT